MTRLYGDAIDNAVDDGADVRRRDDEPELFQWRGRRYLVRAVLGHWTEAGGWWRVAVGSALAGGVGAVDDREREFWRVEAGVGSGADTGVFDLCFDWSPGRWTVVRVQD